ncbi:MAG: helix-turn-helix domain-containing protein, partial [Pseudomonadales bacterium]|nr:helix-turn-helix domain-containing protein [Pseudomonadales bacterium]
MFKATKVRLYPTSAQRRALAFQFGAMRWAYNFALHWRREAWAERGERISKRMTLDRLVELKAAEETAWLKEADSQALQQSVIHLDDAFQRFFKELGRYPRFKSKHCKQSMSYPQRVKVVEGRALYLPKVGVVK